MKNWIYTLACLSLLATSALCGPPALPIVSTRPRPALHPVLHSPKAGAGSAAMAKTLVAVNPPAFPVMAFVFFAGGPLPPDVASNDMRAVLLTSTNCRDFRIRGIYPLDGQTITNRDATGLPQEFGMVLLTPWAAGATELHIRPCYTPIP